MRVHPLRFRRAIASVVYPAASHGHYRQSDGHRREAAVIFRKPKPLYRSTWEALEALRFSPGGILDIGAHKALWAKRAAKIFPGVPIYMVEAQPDLEPDLKASGFPYALCLLGPETKDGVTFHVDPEWPTGGSVMREVTAFDKQTVTLPMKRLDDIATGLTGPLLMKLDVQGFELEVLAGATEALKQTEVILAEVALLEYNEGAPLIAEVIAFLAARGFLPFDIGDLMRRHEDGALFQCDMIFVRADSQLRAKRKFFAHER